MEKPNKIIEIEKNEGQLSIMNVWTCFDLEKFRNNKKLKPLVSESIVSFDGTIQYNQIIFSTPAGYYLFIYRNDEGNYHLKIYYKEEQYNEVLIFVKQLIKK